MFAGDTRQRWAIALLFTALSGSWVGVPLPVQATTGAIRLAPAIATAEPAAAAREVFFTNRVEATLPSVVRLQARPTATANSAPMTKQNCGSNRPMAIHRSGGTSLSPPTDAALRACRRRT